MPRSGRGLRITNRRVLGQLVRQGMLSPADLALVRMSRPNGDILEKVQEAVAANLASSLDRAWIDEGALRIELPGARLIGYNSLLRIDRRKIDRYRKSWLARIQRLGSLSAAVRNGWSQSLKPGWPVVVELIRVVPRRPFLDPDSVGAAAKYLLDGLVRAGFLKDDGPAHIAQSLPHQMVGRHCVHLRIAPAPAAHGFVNTSLIEELQAKVQLEGCE